MEQFKETLREALKNCGTPQEIHAAIGSAVLDYTAENRKKSKEAHLYSRRACYFSMEFLVGRAVYNNLLCLGLYDAAEEVLNEKGTSLSALEEIEDAALGNGGLGRLAACFLDSAASMNLPLDGYGIRYKYGLFKQGMENGFQTETADNWTQYGDPWSERIDKDTVEVRYNGQTVKAVPYDMPIFGCKTNHSGTLRLWQAEAINEFDFDLFNQQKYLDASREKTSAEDISRVLYPNDDTREGKKLRLKQQYFFCSASLQDITKKHYDRFGTLENIADSISVQLNDTHPVISIPELIRILMNGGMNFEKAFAIAKNVFNYTNHTVMPEALEKWECSLIEELLPEVYSIILQIHEKLISDMYSKQIKKEKIDKIMIIRNGLVNMADMAVYCSSYVNGVAEIHTEILKETVLADWYSIYPERFQNKTNGITQRRWLALCNRKLASLITDLTNGEEWMTDLDRLKSLKQFEDNGEIIGEFLNIKKENKRALAEYIKEKEGIEINPNSIFDIQIKRLHEYKRQLLNAFSILYIYFGIKSGEIKSMNPVTFIFGAKSAPGYRRAKGIIKYINEIAKLIENDSAVNRFIKVVFVSNYNVSYAEKLIPAADVSEQISTAGTEASGTGNMKLMLNGAVTLGTYDGANIEIVQEAGEENNYIFGAKVEELKEIMPEYNSRKLMAENEKIRRVVSTLIDGTVSDGGTGVFRELYYSLTDGASWHSPDNYYLLGDLESYVEAKLRCYNDFSSGKVIGKKMWLNMCNAGKFSSDRTIKDYAENIWHIGNIEM
ncbi:MAG: glycogen/starch/alpha-glucan phosphorylase [Clostridium sp.]|nr:glycogen/starch/alpha-glucan phosphorylase [Clostridium sp.]MCM1547716.1 glycogen/starch/alpha-glucan phosphorylase [Ruminococcus sp.]